MSSTHTISYYIRNKCSPSEDETTTKNGNYANHKMWQMPSWMMSIASKYYSYVTVNFVCLHTNIRQVFQIHQNNSDSVHTNCYCTNTLEPDVHSS